MSGSDIGTLRIIRSRRLEQATAERQRSERQLADARQAEAEAQRRLKQAEEDGQARIEGIYDELFAAGICTVKDLDDLRMEEALLREKLAQLAKEAKDAAAAVSAAEDKLEEARKHLVEMNADVEAIDLLDEQHQAEQKLEDARQEDEIIDEVALLRRG